MVGKDPGNIRRMLINGTLSGEKIGNQWVLPKDTVFPADRRVKSGKYRNWRKCDRRLMNRLNALSRALCGVYGQQLTQGILNVMKELGMSTFHCSWKERIATHSMTKWPIWLWIMDWNWGSRCLS